VAAPPAIPSERAPRSIAVLALVLCCGYLGVEVWLFSGDLGFPLDDSWIHLQFARNLAAGDGLAYNPGERVTGSTAPLWTALLALLFALPGNVLWWTKLLGIACHVAGVLATWRLGRALGLGRAACHLAAGLVAANAWLLWSALSGMEISLFVWLTLVAARLHLRERSEPQRPPVAIALFALAALARPEGILQVVAALVDRSLVVRRDPKGPLRLVRPCFAGLARGGLLAAAALAGPVFAYWWIGGSAAPTTMAAKGGELVRWLPDLRYLDLVFGILFESQPWMTLLAVAGVVAALERLGGPDDRGLLLPAWTLGLPLAYSLLSTSPPLVGNFGRYYFPLLPFVVLLGMLGLDRLSQGLGRELLVGRWRLPVAALGVVLLVWPTLTGALRGAGRYTQNVANVHDSDVTIARWLAPRLPPEALLGVNDIGAIKFLLPNRVVDLAGIANPEFRAALRRAAATGTPWETEIFAELERHRPDYLVIFPSWFPGLARDPRFVAVHALEIRDNVTMGGDHVVVFATPWTRHPLHPLPEDPPFAGPAQAAPSAGR
jgi:hypothetical protein